MAKSSGYVSLQTFLKDKDEEVRQVAADALNEAASEIKAQIINNLHNQGIRNRTGKLYSSIDFKKATAKRPRILIKSEVYAPLPKGERSLRALQANYTVGYWRAWRRMHRGVQKFKYPAKGVPYGRIIEFSPRINKPFFYVAWYQKRNKVSNDIVNKITRAWSKRPAYSVKTGGIIYR